MIWWRKLKLRKQAKFQQIHNTSEINVDNLNTVRCEVSRHFRNKKWKYLKDKINKFAMNSNNKTTRNLYRKVNEFKTGYQPRYNLVKGDNG
jgi:hypothetical protein